MKIAMLLFSLTATSVHDFYAKECCADIHCRPVPCDEITALPEGGWKWKETTYSPNMLHISPDGHCHVCFTAQTVPSYTEGIENNRHGETCIYLPPRT